MNKKAKKLDPSLAETIRNKIRSSDSSQNKIAAECGLSRGILSRFMNEERTINIETADKLCRVLGLKLVEIDEE